MEKILVKGGSPLIGEVQVSGAKNAALPILAAGLLATEGTSKFYNVPKLSDIKTISLLFESLGVKVNYKPEENTIEMDARNPLVTEASFEFVSKMRASFLVLGPMLAREGRAKVAMPGGCSIGSRPIDQHLKGFEILGAEVIQDAGFVEARSSKQLEGNNTIFFDFPSVGGTQNVIMASCLAKGKTTIVNAAQEPEIEDMINFLIKMGAKISGKGTSVLEIEGVEKLVGAEYTIMSDRVEAATYMIAAAATRGDVLVKGAPYKDNVALVSKMREMGVEIEVFEDAMRVRNNLETLKPVDVKTLPHPGFLTDMQSIMCVVTLLGNGTSTITETVFENRFMHVEELRRMNAKIRIEGRSSLIEGPAHLEGTTVRATDLRSGAALIIAGLMAKGSTKIIDIYHIDRGYVDIEEKMRKLGADVRRIEE